VLSHATADFRPQAAATVTEVYRQASAPLVLRGHSQIGRFFEGFELVAPGLVQPASWRPDGTGPASPSAGGFYSGVGRMSQTEHAGRMLIDRRGEMTIGRKVVSD